MPATFPITRDDEFYVFLKTSLPHGFEIQAEPQAGYYSEYCFCYKLYNHGELLKTFRGDFHTIAKGSLVAEAESILTQIENTI